ncbi:MAG: thiosulfate oxidation carrier complex protein SoxZ [Meiothermus sp.]|uniref:thiosulfate oxidation carrier complex protein SoxZ n=1 Tax=Meiothermus sp. TaxID=1955249 RepID=UPI0025E9CEBD|nr:thiosulfate oxidation carrier complex protein SoxZ [Meiothermus sp.]MCS7058084.1 thiosulfate oxidation carrier complex protein SoxZ [Meiothermus sp.]MCS7194049.1 thiosulfate oxidation carrier complex protein SoxZ [Meiothermus sp.]MCX7740291.1 thiosulfate oxidation carrier complex protein SoxZ [Meiothermus sp.]MDW8091175.1 thiosulfate oxidation carrier complex protein SoxZ [Meiothermus sp.]MDW8480448.1 thiosulfate oxidation carrier complex protein SoxZ [Meiothermus sp.]
MNILIRFNPARPKAGEEVRVQIVIQHPMEPGTRRDASGKLIPADHINELTVLFDGQPIATVKPGPGTSANPLFAFKMKAAKAGQIKVVAKDLTGKSGERTADLALA